MVYLIKQTSPNSTRVILLVEFILQKRGIINCWKIWNKTLGKMKQVSYILEMLPTKL